MAAGSDWPVAMTVPNPWLSFETMVTRRSPDPAFPGSLAVGQALGLGEQTGRLSPGMSSDFIVLDRNLLGTSIAQIHDTQVRQTWFAGRLVHDGSSAS